MEPRPELARYLERRHPGAVLEPFAGDASTRTFWRLTLPDGATRVVMDYGAPFTGPTDDLRLARVFTDASLPVARVLEDAPEPGCLVLQDLGAWTMERALLDETGAAAAERSLPGAPELRRERLYAGATRLAADIAVSGSRALAASPLADGPALDSERFRFEMDFFVEHYLGAYRKAGAVAGHRIEQLHALADLAAETPERVLCHRDYHSRNLMVRPDGSLAMVDIQDARWGPDSYDLASLLRDAYVDVPEELVERMIRLYGRHLSKPPDPEAFRRRFDIVAAQRMIKALGTFGYQIAVRGRRRYEDAVPRTLRRLSRLLPRRPETAQLVALIQ